MILPWLIRQMEDDAATWVERLRRRPAELCGEGTCRRCGFCCWRCPFEQVTSSGRWLGRYVRYPFAAKVGHRQWNVRWIESVFEEVLPTEDSGERCECDACQRDEAVFIEEKKT